MYLLSSKITKLFLYKKIYSMDALIRNQFGNQYVILHFELYVCFETIYWTNSLLTQIDNDFHKYTCLSHVRFTSSSIKVVDKSFCFANCDLVKSEKEWSSIGVNTGRPLYKLIKFVVRILKFSLKKIIKIKQFV
ncbi:Protein of unknown function [Gryllus bimaculatus]|nr:Protein of unknown function [Gryllus bimaculatus]